MSDTPSRQTLELVLGRCITFIIGVAKYPAAAAILADRGYDQSETDYVWSRLTLLGTLPKGGPAPGAQAKEVREAVVELDAWDNRHFPVIRNILERSYPTFVDTIFKDLEAKEGEESVDAVATLLNRLDAVEQSQDPEASAVLKLLGKRGYPPAERQRLRGLIDATKKFAPKSPLSDADRVKILMELYGWITDWSTTARAVITRRQHLIALGLASPRKPDKEEPEQGTTAPAAPVAAATPPVAPANAPAAPPAAPATPPNGGK